MHLDELTRPDLIFADLRGSDAPTILRSLAEQAEARGLVDDADELYRRLFEREQLGSTGLGGGVAVPHCKIDDIDHVALAIGVAPQGIDFAAVDGEPVKLFFLIVSPSKNPAAHLQALAAVSKWLKVDDNARRIVSLDTREEIHDLIRTRAAAASR